MKTWEKKCLSNIFNKSVTHDAIVKTTEPKALEHSLHDLSMQTDHLTHSYHKFA